MDAREDLLQELECSDFELLAAAECDRQTGILACLFIIISTA